LLTPSTTDGKKLIFSERQHPFVRKSTLK